MIINVICPNCGKKIQVDDSNDANICLLCGKPFVTKNAKAFSNDNTVHVDTNTIKEEDRLFNNIKGLAYKNDSNSIASFDKNSKSFILNYPLDNRIFEVNYYVAYKEYVRYKKESEKYDSDYIGDGLFNAIKKLIKTLLLLKENDINAYNENHKILIDSINKDTKYTGDSLDIKLYLEKFDLNKFKKGIIKYEEEMIKYERDVQSYNRMVSEQNSLPPWKPGMPVRIIPIKPIKPFTNLYKWINTFTTLKKDFKAKNFPLDEEYILDLCSSFDLYDDGFSETSNFFNDYSDVLLSILPKDKQNIIKERRRKEEERIRLEEEKRKAKEDLEVIEYVIKFWVRYESYLKAKEYKKAYDLINDPRNHTVLNKKIYVEMEYPKLKKGLFGVKYKGDVNSFNTTSYVETCLNKLNIKLPSELKK